MASPTPPTPLDPGDPRAGDPTKISTWVTIGGVLVLIIVIGTINQWNRGPKGSPKPPSTASSTVSTPGSTSAPPTGTYKIIFDGTATGHYDVPNRGQAYRSSDATATWHLEYSYGNNNDSDYPDPATTKISGSGNSQVWPSNEVNCVSQAPRYFPKVSLLKRPGGGDTFRLYAPFMGDLVDARGTCLSYSKAWYASCGTGSTHCPDLDAFWKATFTIKPDQTGTVVTRIAPPKLDYVNNQPVLGGDHAIDSWSGTITVIAQ